MLSRKKKERKFTLQDQIIVSVVNTLILGGILALLTFYLNKRIERSKIKESFSTEFNKIKAQKIGESWEKLNELEAKTSMLLDLMKKNIDSIKIGKKLSIQDSIYFYQWLNETRGYEWLFYIEKNRFWIGEEHYQIMGSFVSLIARKQNNYLKYNQDSIRIINDLIHQKREKLDIVIQNLLQKE